MSGLQAAGAGPRLAGGPGAFREQMARGRALLDSGAFDAAEAAARQALALAPQEAVPVLLLAQIAQRRDGPTQRVEILAQHLDRFGGDIRIRRQLVDALILTGAFADALPHADWLAGREAAEGRDHMMRARCLMELGELDRAEAAARQAQSLAPQDVAPVLLLARIAQRRGDPALRAEILGKGLRRFPGARGLVMQVLSQAGLFEEPLRREAFRSARALLQAPEVEDVALAITAARAAERFLSSTPEAEEFIAWAEAAIARQSDPRVWRAQWLVAHRQFDEAVRLLEARLVDAPTDRGALQLRLRIAAMQGEWGRDAALFLDGEAQLPPNVPLAQKIRAIRDFFRFRGMRLEDARDRTSPAARLSTPVDVVAALCDSTPITEPDGTRNGIMMVADTLMAGGAEKIIAALYGGLRRRHPAEALQIWLLTRQGSGLHDPLYCLATRHPELAREVRYVDRGAPYRDEGIFRFLPHEWEQIVQAIHDEIRARRPEVVYAALDYINIFTAIAALAAGVPRIVLHVHNARPTSLTAEPGIVASFTSCYRMLAARPEVRIVACSDAVAEDFQAWCALPDRRAITTVHNGYDLPDDAALARRDPAAIRAELGLPATAPVVGTAMRLVWVKRPGRWLEAARIILDRVPAAHFVIFGYGDLLEELRAEAAALGLGDRLHFADWQSDVFRAMRCMDVFMLSSGSEGFGNVLVEAQACGVPPVAYDVGGCRETMLPGLTGKIVGEDTAEALAAAAVEVLEDDGWRRTAGTVGRDFVLQKFSTERMVRTMEDVMR